MKILVLGNGFMGARIAKYFSCDVSSGEISKITKEVLDGYDVVINTIAKTNVDWCEENKFETFRVNTYEAVRLAAETRGKYVFISSGCIFKSLHAGDIKKESAIPEPECMYTYSKVIAERMIQQINPQAIIIRPRLLTSFEPHEKNTIDKILKYVKLTSSQESFTVLEDMLPILDELIMTYAFGIYNIANSGTISPSEIAHLFGKKHLLTTAKELAADGRVERVSVVMGSDRLLRLPDIRNRILEIKGYRKL